MRAALLTAIPADALEFADVDAPVPGPDEVLVQVAACGICGTDLHILDGASYRPVLPFVLGHEPVGTVVQVGSQRSAAWLGRRVTMTLFRGDGDCPACRAGHQRLCPDLKGLLGVFQDPGGFAEQLVVPTGQFVELPASLGFSEAASLVDAGATAANSVRLMGELLGRSPYGADGLVVIVGGGPIGALVAELARHSGRRCLVVQSSAARRQMISALGHRVVETLEEVPERPVAVIDCAGAPRVLPRAIEMLLPRGVFIAAGYSMVRDLDMATVARKELVAAGVRSGTREDLVGILDLASSGAISVPPVYTWELAQINDALTALREKRVPGKAVVTLAGPG